MCYLFYLKKLFGRSFLNEFLVTGEKEDLRSHLICGLWLLCCPRFYSELRPPFFFFLDLILNLFYFTSPYKQTGEWVSLVHNPLFKYPVTFQLLNWLIHMFHTKEHNFSQTEWTMAQIKWLYRH